MKKVEPFFQPMQKPKPYEWLGSHTEPGQTFDEYRGGDPTLPKDPRGTIYILPIGKFSAQQKQIIDVAAGYLEVFYDLPVIRMPEQRFRQNVGADNHRRNKLLGTDQIRTGYILDQLLKPTLPADGAALIAFTDRDLYPDASMNYVFGQASFEDRVGVWSLSRLDDRADQATFLRRTLKIAAHETGHMFSMRHCTKYECVMSGTNYLGETDRRPIDACPECMAKICWLSCVTPGERYARLAEFCRKYRLVKEADEFQKKAQAVG